MKTKLVTNNIWRRITNAAKLSPFKANVAVAYFSKSSLLPLREGSKLVVNFSEQAVKSGQTNPEEILKLINKGVEVFSVPNLHAKVFVLKNSAYIGSANASQNSAKHLLEALVETKEPTLVSAARKYVRSLCLNLVTYNEAKQMAKLYKPPKFFARQINLAGTRRKLVCLPPIKVVVLEYEKLDEATKRAEKDGDKIAETNEVLSKPGFVGNYF